MRKNTIIIWSLLVAPFLLAAVVYKMMPVVMACHWNILGEADGFMTKAWGLFSMPAIGLILFGLFGLLPKVDPYKANVAKFKEVYEDIIIVFLVFLLYLHVLIVAWNLGYTFNFIMFIVPAFAILFYILGWALRKTERNWFVGIRTPWTLSSSHVWKKTHELGSRMFKILSLVILASLFFKEASFLVLIIGVIFVGLYLTVFSYFEYKKEQESGK